MPELEAIKQATQDLNEAVKHVQDLHADVKEREKNANQVITTGKEWLEKLSGVDVEAIKRASQAATEAEEKLAKLRTELERPATIEPVDAKTASKLAPMWKTHLEATQHKGEITPEVKDQARAAFEKYLRQGKEHLILDELKLLASDNQAQGGYLVVPEFANEIIKDLANINEVRSIARVRQTMGISWQVPKRTTRVQGGWVGQQQAASESNSEYGLLDIPNGKIAAYSEATEEQLADASFDMEAQIREDLVEAFAALEGEAFVDGDGLQKPRGFMATAGVITVNGGDASALTYAGLVRLSHGDATNGDWNPQYLRNARFVLSSTTLGDVRLIEDTSGRLVYAVQTQAAAPATILGYPYTILPGMDAVAANAFPVAFGDFRQGYIILDRIAFSLLRNPYSRDTAGIVRFTASRRVGGDVLNSAAIRKLKVAA